jgi:hypothetical protein
MMIGFHISLKKINEVRNPIIIFGGMTEKESDVRNTIIIFGGGPKKKVKSGILSSFLASGILSSVLRKEWFENFSIILF